ncbi:MAG: hypothetical protein FWG50_11650 [Kiritimatiellaeota bacterium]|nr:hypothetical protein [Kiritimatiellota bacterium]
MKKVLFVMIVMTALCVRSAVFHEEVEGKSTEELCKLLEEKFDDPGVVNAAMWSFYCGDGADRASYGNKEALGWARRVVKEKKTGYHITTAMDYLGQKGNAEDIALLSQYLVGRKLSARVAGTNLLNNHLTDFEGLWWLGCTPSVTNTGPQGLYVEAILRQYWENLEVGKDRHGNPYRDQSKIPPEIQTLVVSFDKKGNPVCNVDLAKYGLTMPEIDVPNRPKGKGKLGIKNQGLGMGDEKSRMRRLWPYALATALTALATLLLARRRRR